MSRLRAGGALVCLALVALPGGLGAGAVDLSPASWPDGDLDRYTRLNGQSLRDRPQAAGREGMVVGTSGALAVRAGLEALRQGGSAADAAIVTALTQVTLAAGAWVSYAGIWSLVYHDAATGKTRYMNAEFATLLEEDDPLTIPASGPSGRTAMTPGFMAGVEETHRRWGRLPFEELFVPAIFFAEEGFPIDADLAGTMEFRRDVLSRLPATRSIFFKPDGSLYRQGEIFRQPQLAETLGRVARQGADYMYVGAWADRLVEALRAEGGKMTAADLRDYRVIVKRPKRVRYRGLTLYAPSKPSAGGQLLSRTFRQLRPRDVARQGHGTESADTLFDLMSSTRDAYKLVPPLGAHSDAVVAIDADGNVAALLHTINTLAWGETGIFVDGVSIPDAAAHQQRRVLDAGPGNRIWSGGDPVVVRRKKMAVAGSAATGRGLFESTVQGLTNMIDFGMEPKAAVEAPAFRAPRRLEEGGIESTLVTSGDFAPDLLRAVRDRGIPIRELGRLDFEGRGYWITATRDPKSGEILGATSRYFNGLAEGY